MKNIKTLFFLVLTFTTLVSCSYEEEIGSKVTNYAVITLNNDEDGDNVTVINKGTTYVEPGAIAIIDEKKVDVKIGGDIVNTNTIGVYKVDYSSTNIDGFTKTITRTVIVMSPTPSAIDLSGTFFRNGNANNITRISDRVYVADNAGGLVRASDADKAILVKIKFYNLDDTKVYAPFQTGTSTSGISAETNIGQIINKNSFNWVLYASATYGTAVRNFTR